MGKVINGVTWKLTTDEIITGYNSEGDELGNIYNNFDENEISDWQRILDGHDPIKEGWEDGIGNPVSIDGWGIEEEDKEEEEIIYNVLEWE